MRTKRDKAYEYIKSEILAGRLLPGQRIVLSQVASALGVSAVPVREALFQLDNEHLVAFTPHVGAMVAIADVDSLVSIIEPLAVLEGYATRLARHSPSLPAVVEELGARNEEMRHYAIDEDWQGVGRANKAFHFVLYEACGNDVLLGNIRGLWERLEAQLGLRSFHLIPTRAMSSIGDHEAIMKMLLDPDTEDLEVELVAREHKMETSRRFARHGRRAQEAAPRHVAGGP